MLQGEFRRDFEYYGEVDGLRALAVAVVILFHLNVPGFAGGFVGVDVFFVISGFLITMVANDRYANRPVAFLSNRFLRIYPTYWTCAAIGFAVVALYPASRAIHPSLVLPVSAHDWFANLFVFGASAFPQNIGYNPTGLVGALTYFAVDAIKAKYLKNPGPLVPA